METHEARSINDHLSEAKGVGLFPLGFTSTKEVQVHSYSPVELRYNTSTGCIDWGRRTIKVPPH